MSLQEIVNRIDVQDIIYFQLMAEKARLNLLLKEARKQ